MTPPVLTTAQSSIACSGVFADESGCTKPEPPVLRCATTSRRKTQPQLCEQICCWFSEHTRKTGGGLTAFAHKSAVRLVGRSIPNDCDPAGSSFQGCGQSLCRPLHSNVNQENTPVNFSLVQWQEAVSILQENNGGPSLSACQAGWTCAA